MAFDRLPFSFPEPQRTIALADALALTYSAGADLGNGGDFHAAGVALVVAAHPVDGFGQPFNCAVQTADARATTDPEWVDIAAQLNGVTAAGTYTLVIADTILDKIRLKFTAADGVSPIACVMDVHWLTDRLV